MCVKITVVAAIVPSAPFLVHSYREEVLVGLSRAMVFHLALPFIPSRFCWIQ